MCSEHAGHVQYIPAELRRGLIVVVLEQATEICSRQVFVAISTSRRRRSLLQTHESPVTQARLDNARNATGLRDLLLRRGEPQSALLSRDSNRI